MSSSKHCFIQISLLLGVFILLLAQKAWAAPRAVAPLSPRKPPFNGSIFGKRSVSSPMDGETSSSRYADFMSSNRLAYLIRQQEILMQAFVNHCSEPQQVLDSTFCAELMGNNLQSNGDPRGTSDRAGSSLYQVS